MSKFFNTVDQLGDDAVVDSILEGTIVEFRDDTVTVLGQGCLSYLYSSLKTVDCPSATAIEASAIAYSYLVEFVRTSAKVIKPHAFQLAQKMTMLVLCGDSVCTLENINAFASCHHYYGTVNTAYNKDGLKDGYIYVPRALVEDYKVATNWSTFATQFRAIEDYTLGSIYGTLIFDDTTEIFDDEVTTIPDERFKDWDNLVTINLSAVTEVGKSAFDGCSALADVNLPNVKIIRNKAFNDCDNITEITLPSVTLIEGQAFAMNSGLKKVDIGGTVTLPNYAFYGTGVLEAVILRSRTIGVIGNAAVFTSNKVFIYVPKDMLEEYRVTGNWSLYADKLRAIEDYPEICG